jgi:hypothetical protein
MSPDTMIVSAVKNKSFLSRNSVTVFQLILSQLIEALFIYVCHLTLDCSVGIHYNPLNS